jgi:hypothetical protein
MLDAQRALLTHFLAALAYRTQKALRDAPPDFGTFEAGRDVRSPAELVRHMTSVLGYARTYFIGGRYWPDPLPDLAAEIRRFHSMVAALAAHLESGDTLQGITPAQLLQGPFSDAMTHAGQLALLRRLAGTPVPPRTSSSRTCRGRGWDRISLPRAAPTRCGRRRRPAGRRLRRLRSPDLITPESQPYHSGVVTAPLRSRCGTTPEWCRNCYRAWRGLH